LRENQQIDALASGASMDISQSLAISPNLSAGHHWVAGCVDPVSGEAQTANNCAKGVEIVVAAGMCDAIELSVDRQKYSDFHFLKSQTSVSLGDSQVVHNGELYIETPAVRLGSNGTSFTVETGSVFSAISAVPSCP